MSLFTTILEKLGLRKEAPVPSAASTPKSPASASPPAKTAPVSSTSGTYTPAHSALPPKAVAIPVVDVMAKLEAMAAKRPEKLNWKVSIADLLFLLGIDNSFKARKALAEELGCPPSFMDDSAKMNTWLHKTVLRKIAENGGNIPQALLD